MLQFHSASARIVDSRKAIAECLELAMGSSAADCDLLFVCASIGHDFTQLAEEASRLAPHAVIVGSSCCGVVGSEGVSESMRDVAIMAVEGRDFAAAHRDMVFADNCFEQCRAMALELCSQRSDIRFIYFLGSGIDIANDLCIAAIEGVFGPEVTIFGATSSDNMRGVTSHQIYGRQCFTHSAWMVGFADPSLVVDTAAVHGFLAIGEPLEVTRSDRNRIMEFNGRPAWDVYTEKLGMRPEVGCGETIPIGALGEVLASADAGEYLNPHILRVVTKKDDDGTMHYATTVKEGALLYLTIRDEGRIFGDLESMVRGMLARANGKPPVAVFHADCLARGRHLFNRVIKEELVLKMQMPMACDGVIPPWLGLYGFGEFARLNGRNEYHNYTTALCCLYRR